MGLSDEQKHYPLSDSVKYAYLKYLRKRRLELIQFSFEFIGYVLLFLLLFFNEELNELYQIRIIVGNNTGKAMFIAYLLIGVLFFNLWVRVVIWFAADIPFLRQWQERKERKELEKLKSSILYIKRS